MQSPTLYSSYMYLGTLDVTVMMLMIEIMYGVAVPNQSLLPTNEGPPNNKNLQLTNIMLRYV